MKGMNAATGKAIEGDEWLAQAAADILLTPLGTRVMRRDYGAELPDLIDQPLNDLLRLRIYAATAGALRKWLPQLSLTRCSLARDGEGSAALTLEGHRADLPKFRAFTSLTIPLGR